MIDTLFAHLSPTTQLAVVAAIAFMTWGTCAALVRSLRGTTLIPAVLWSCGASAVLFATAMCTVQQRWPLGSAERLNARYLTAMFLFCPVMSVLGARRPHHLAWQWIVVSLIAVLGLPVAEAYVVQRGAAVKIHDARSYFLAAMIVACLLNYVPTRFGGAAVAVAGAQLILVSEHMPGWRRVAGQSDELVACFLVGLACGLGWVCRSVAWSESADTRAWRRYRDAFGTLWALRMQDRMNHYAEMYRWPFHLRWSGFVRYAPVDSEAENPMAENPAPDPSKTGVAYELSDEMRQSWWSLLRRFVDSSWIPADRPRG
jgi:hypothetical protein